MFFIPKAEAAFFPPSLKILYIAHINHTLLETGFIGRRESSFDISLKVLYSKGLQLTGSNA